MSQLPEAFLEQFNAARQDGLERTLDASPVASEIRDWAETNVGLIEEHPAKHGLMASCPFAQRHWQPRPPNHRRATLKALGHGNQRTRP